jgi:Kef-type K+ transport system membrane component KefB
VAYIAQELIATSILLALILCSWGLCKALLRGAQSAVLPDFLLYILAGVLIKLLYDAAFPDGPSLSSKQNSTLAAVQFIALFLFITPNCAGLRFERIGDNAKEVFSLVAGSVLAFLLALVTVPLVSRIAPDPLFIDAGENARLGHFLALSLGAMVTSLPFLTKILFNNGLLKSAFGNSILLSACLVDILVWVLFSVAVSIFLTGVTDVSSAAWHILWALTLISFALSSGILLARFFVAIGNVSTRHAFSFPLVAIGVFMAFTTLLGLAPIVGMVITGLVTGSIRDHIPLVVERMEKISAAFGAPVYFVCVGFSLNLSTSLNFAMIAVFLLWTSAVKIGAVAFTTSFLRHPSSDSLSFGIAMNTRGGPGLVLAAASYSIGLVGITGFTAMTLASVITAFITDVYLKTVTKQRSKAGAAPAHD